MPPKKVDLIVENAKFVLTMAPERRLLENASIAVHDKNIVAIGDAVAVRSRTLIVDLSGKEYTAQKLAEWLHLPGDSIVDISDPAAAGFTGSTGDIVVVLGSDARLTTAVLPTGD